MWIHDLILHNIQSFEDAQMSFSKGINLIVGRNNSGKSAIIRSLQNFQHGYAKPELLLRKFSDSGYIVASVVDLVQSPTMKNTPDGEFPAMIFNAKDRSFGFATIFSDLPKSSTKFKSYFDKAKAEGELVDLPRFHDNESSNIFIPFLGKRKTQYLNGQFDAKSLRSIDQDFRNIAPKLSRATSNTNRKQFEEACLNIMGFVPAALPGEGGVNMTNVAHYVDSDETVSLEQMGDGIIQIVGLLVNLFHVKNKIFLIEEIENDLHPDALKQLLALIISASKHYQFIITTHSNIVVSTLGKEIDSKIFEINSRLIEDEVEGRSLFKSAISQIDNSTDERIRILRDLGYDLSDFHLWNAYLILEESSAEKLIRDFLIPAFCPKLINRLATIGAKGASDVPIRYSHLRSVFTFIHTTEIYKERAWVCVDNDKAGNDAINKLKSSFKTWEPDHFILFSQPDFECYYPGEYHKEIEIIKHEADSDLRGKLKLDLAKLVVKKFNHSPTEVVEIFKESAREVIDLLKRIEKDLYDKNSE